jgi:phenylpropionate dioxygenase-like ring-hydroxylating dioxygenase large terminal subunit
MLSVEENELLTRIGPGTPMGDYLRRYWHPILLASELPAPDCPPVRVRLLGEDLVAFRDSEGRVGLLAEHCAHRGASLYFGRNEDRGLRCVYHGWKWDVAGRCLDMPNEPATSTFKDRVRQPAFPTAERGGLVWAYLGPPDRKAELPDFEWMRVPPDHLHISKWLMEANYLQGMEGEVDTSHISFLHTYFDLADAPPRIAKRRVGNWRAGVAPQLTVKETEYGFVYGARRQSVDGSESHWRVTHWLLPTYSLIPGPTWPVGGRCWIPIDDEHTWVYNWWYSAEGPLPPEDIAWIEANLLTPPAVDPRTFRPLLNKANEYGLNRAEQRSKTYTGIFGGGTQDRAIVESMGPVFDRSKEHLGQSDVAVIAARRRLLAELRRLQMGEEPSAASHGALYHLRALDVVSRADALDAVLAESREALRAVV